MKAGRVPDAVLAGHVHNYQRFTRTLQKPKNRKVTYLVAGAGGYWHLHPMQKDNGHAIATPHSVAGTDVVLEKYCDDRHGYLKLDITPQHISGDYFTVPRPQEAWTKPAQRIDSFQIPLGQ